MRLLADENVPLAAVLGLRGAGHDVAQIAEVAQSTSDSTVLAIARQELRTVVTLDKDFGELAFKAKASVPQGIILCRVENADAARLSEILTAALESRSDWAGHFAVIERDRIRMTPIPPPT